MKHLRAMWVERAGRSLSPAELAATNAFFEARGKRALQRHRAGKDEDFDEV